MGDCEKIMDIIREDVKYEDELVELVIHVCLSAWSREPLNLFLKGSSAVGKDGKKICIHKRCLKRC